MKFAIALAVLLVAVAFVEAGLPPPPQCCDDIVCNCCITEDECVCRGGTWCPGNNFPNDCCPTCFDCNGKDLCKDVVVSPYSPPRGSGGGATASASSAAIAAANANANSGGGAAASATAAAVASANANAGTVDC